MRTDFWMPSGVLNTAVTAVATLPLTAPIAVLAAFAAPDDPFSTDRCMVPSWMVMAAVLPRLNPLMMSSRRPVKKKRLLAGDGIGRTTKDQPARFIAIEVTGI